MFVRKFNSKGTDIFKDRILSLGKDENEEVYFEDLLQDNAYSVLLQENIEVKTSIFTSSFALGKYLYSLLNDIDKTMTANDNHLWNWLSCFYFDLITVNKKSGKREIGEMKKYILDSSSVNFYKHHIFSAWFFYNLFKDRSRIILNTPVWSIGKVSRLIANNKYIINYPDLIEVIYELYWDFNSSRSKKDYLNERIPGNITRFPTVLNQLMLTYDIFSLSAKEILDLLPREFDIWRQGNGDEQ
jgi:uncharacterized membrane protein (GlpM family)